MGTNISISMLIIIFLIMLSLKFGKMYREKECMKNGNISKCRKLKSYLFYHSNIKLSH